nr:hypothetical protein 1 [bacterium]
MKGGIYSDQKCLICGGIFQDNKKDALICPDHPEQRATRFKIRFGRGISRRFKDYEAADRFVTGLRYKSDEGTFDPRDYQSDNPMGFTNLADQWLEIKKREIRKGSFKNLNNYMKRAMEAWGNKNVKEIGYADIEDFLLEQKLLKSGEPVSDKTKSNMRSALHDFWTWLRKRRVIRFEQMPDFPEARFELGFRNTVNKPTQEKILEEVHRISFHINPKIWLGIKWLCTYISVRPGELLDAREKHIDLVNGYLAIPFPKEKKPKLVPLIEEDIELVKSLPRGMPDLPFFRHEKGVKGCRQGQQFGDKYLYKWWKKACTNLGIDDVDLYGGTRHSSAIALKKYRTPEEIKRASMHSTNKAFERYFWMESDDIREIYMDASGGKKKVKAKVIKINE